MAYAAPGKSGPRSVVPTKDLLAAVPAGSWVGESGTLAGETGLSRGLCQRWGVYRSGVTYQALPGTGGEPLLAQSFTV